MSTNIWHLPEDRFFDPDPAQRHVARELSARVAGLPIVSPHGHVDPRLLADRHASFGTPADLFIIPDHYVFRMLYSQGVSLEALGVPRRTAARWRPDHRKIWQAFAEHYYLFRGTPSGMWLDHELVEVFGVPTEAERRQRPGHLRRDRSEIGGRPNSGHGRSSNGSTSKPCPRPTLPSDPLIASPGDGSIGMGWPRSSPPSGRMRWSTC